MDLPKYIEEYYHNQKFLILFSSFNLQHLLTVRKISFILLYIEWNKKYFQGSSQNLFGKIQYKKTPKYSIQEKFGSEIIIVHQIP